MKIFKKIFNHEIWGFNKMHLKYIALPDLISLINASLGFLAIIMAARGDLALAAKFILLAVIFDFLDGWIWKKYRFIIRCDLIWCCTRNSFVFSIHIL